MKRSELRLKVGDSVTGGPIFQGERWTVGKVEYPPLDEYSALANLAGTPDFGAWFTMDGRSILCHSAFDITNVNGEAIEEDEVAEA